MRVDRFLTDSISAQVEGLSRNRIQGLIAGGHVRCGDDLVNESKTKVRAGDSYIVTLPPPEPAEPEPQDIPLDIVFEDDDLLVIVKPAGLVVHPAPGNPDGTLVNAVLAHCGPSLSGIGGVARPGIVHRLDKDTSGLMVVAKNAHAHSFLSEQFARHSVTRAYNALVWGVPAPLQGSIEGTIGRSPHNRKKMAVVERGGKHAVTHYKVLKVFHMTASLIECRLETGRTHQIRVHMASMGHPVMGDPLYGSNDRHMRRVGENVKQVLVEYKYQALHAVQLGFNHPATKERLFFESDKTIYINKLIANLEN
jgi:23S rRNA pseudouridine1911/1915/1917 synthase